MTEKKPNLSTLAFLGFHVNSALDKGHRDTISFQDLYDSLDNGTLLEDLASRIPGVFDWGLFPPGSEQSVGLNQALNNVSYASRGGRERRKLLIEDSGLHLLMALVVEAMQQKEWVDPE